MKKIKTELNIKSFPDEIKYVLKNAIVYDSSCSSNATVYYIDTATM